MKKIALFFAMLVAGINMSVQAQTWEEMGTALASVINTMTDEMTAAFASQGIPADAYATYNKPQKALDVVIDFGDLDIIPFLNDSILENTKNEFLSSFLESTLSDDPDGSNVSELVNVMGKDNGQIRIVLEAAGKKKAVGINATDIRKAAKAQYGISL